MPTPARQLRPTHRAIVEYYRGLQSFRSQDVEHEQAVRSAFLLLLTETAKPFKWTAIPELGAKTRGKRIVPDGTLRDSFHIPRGYWEAKDSADNLDAEIVAKTKKGYPTNNTIFWTPDRAVLFQNQRKQLDLPILDDEDGRRALCDLLNAYFSYVDEPIYNFEEAVEEFTQRVPELGKRLAEIIAESHNTNTTFKRAFGAFFELCRISLNPNIAPAAVDEMLIQHLLTERLFKTVFKSPEFARKNVIAAEVEKVIDALSSRSFTRGDFLRALDRFYVAIERTATRIADFADKQHFLNSIYERFFQGYCVKTADTHGIVYTPQPIVDFMCASVEHVLKEEFGKALGDEGVLILDPCTGTGNFVVNLMRRAAARGKRQLLRIYREQIFANEIMLMPYYIAALNIEHAYFEETGEYEAFEGLCFVDTLELAEPKHTGLFTERNAERVTRQQSAPITVVIGNPPYNVGQMTHNEQNRNRPYPTVDHWIRDSYAKDSAATSVSKLNDPYVKFFKWATRRLNNRDGIVCFVSNNSFVERVAFDGMRKHLAQDFQTIYHLDLEGNVRRNPTLSGTQYNVFGIQVGVGITIAVKHKAIRSHRVRYATVPKQLRRLEKLRWLAEHRTVSGVKWTLLKPSAKHAWIVLENSDQFASYVPIADKTARANGPGAPDVIFKDYSLGIDTHRDDVVYDFSGDLLTQRITAFIEEYCIEVDRWKRAPQGSNLDEFVRYDKVVWNPDLKNALRRLRYVRFNGASLRTCQYRPFTRQHVYFDRVLNARVFGWPAITPSEDVNENKIIAATTLGSEKPFMCLVSERLADLHLVGAGAQCQCFPFYIYDEDGTNRRENISDWALRTIREHYGNTRISKWDIFHYIYALLHHRGYRETFAENLKHELPKIPLAADFKTFAKAGVRLAGLHINYDKPMVVAPHPLREEWIKGKPKTYRVEKMKLSKDKSALFVNDSLTLHEIPPDVYGYRLGNRSALEWVVDQYQVRTDTRSDYTCDPNCWGEEHDDEEYIVRLVKQVVTVSLETNNIVNSLPAEFAQDHTSQGRPRASSRSHYLDSPDLFSQ